MSKCRKDFKQWWVESGIIAGEGSMDAAEEAWNARVPEGYVVVPREPTKALIDALANNFIKAHGIPTRVTPTKAYRAMIASAEEE